MLYEVITRLKCRLKSQNHPNSHHENELRRHQPDQKHHPAPPQRHDITISDRCDAFITFTCKQNELAVCVTALKNTVQRDKKCPEQRHAPNNAKP